MADVLSLRLPATNEPTDTILSLSDELRQLKEPQVPPCDVSACPFAARTSAASSQAAPARAQIAVVGGGIAGLMCALGAGSAGYAVTLFEANPEVCYGAACISARLSGIGQ
jgi:NADPH-dependent 2,4-dienoyl-CoA reductase/sulfur reductase-like enzyme